MERFQASDGVDRRTVLHRSIVDALRADAPASIADAATFRRFAAACVDFLS